LRGILGLKCFPFSQGARILQSITNNPGCNGIGSSHIGIYTASSITNIHTSVAELMTIIYHHRGAPQIWIVVPPTERLRLEDLIRSIFGTELKDNKECSQFIEHLSIFVTPDLLQASGINYFKVRQEEKQTMIVFPGTYISSYSTGFAVLESRYMTGPQWAFDQYRFCYPANRLCERANQSNKPLLKITPQDLQSKQSVLEASIQLIWC
jgi:hypothetical protein